MATVTRALVNKLHDQASVRDWGMHPSRSAADNTTAWNIMMGDLAAGNFGLEILVPPGLYHHNGLVMADRTNLSLHGTAGHPGLGATTAFVCDDPNTHGFHMLRCSNCQIEGVAFLHQAGSAANIWAMVLDGISFCMFSHVSTWGAVPSWGGILLQSSAGAAETFENKFDHCVVLSHDAHGLLLSGTASNRRVGETTLTNCFIWSNGLVGGANGEGLGVLDFCYGVYVRTGTSITNNYNNVVLDASANDFRTRDIFVTAAILDNPVHTNLYGSNVQSVHLVNNWLGSGNGNAQDIYQAHTGAAGWQIKHNVFAANTAIVLLALTGSTSHIAGNVFAGPSGATGVSAAASSADNYLEGNSFIGMTTPIVDAATMNVFGANHVHGLGWDRPNFRKGLQLGGDPDFHLNFLGSDPVISLDANDRLIYTRSADQYAVVINSLVKWLVDPNFTQSNTRLNLMDVNYYLELFSANPIIAFDPNDYLQFSRSLNRYEWIIGNGWQMGLDGAGGSGETPLLLLDVSAGTVKRVKLHPVDPLDATKKYLYVDA